MKPQNPNTDDAWSAAAKHAIASPPGTPNPYAYGTQRWIIWEKARRTSEILPDMRRQTGRTTRMLDFARKAAAEGAHVVVVAGNEHECVRMKHLLHGTEGEIAVMNVHNGAGQWERLPSKNTKVIFDHWTWQSAERATYEVTRLLRFRGIPAYFPE